MQIQTFANIPTLFIMAAEAEYGQNLQHRIQPLMTGIGPVEAAISLTAVLTRAQIQNALPKLLVSLGSAGSRWLNQTHVYQIKSVSWRDMDASALGFEKGVTPLLGLPAEMNLLCPDTGIETARLSTGANIVDYDQYPNIDADLVDMETWALLRVAQTFDIPLIGLRGISDGKEALTGLSDWTKLLGVIDHNLSDALDKLETALLRDGLSVHSKAA